MSSFPSNSLLESGSLPLGEIADLTRREAHRTQDIYRVHRWFARRSAAQFRSILTAITLDADQEGEFWDRYNGDTSLDGLIVFDPFVGGGTSVVEASKCGAQVIGFDIDPVATAITRFELDAKNYSEVLGSVKNVISEPAEKIRSFHRTELSDGTKAEVLHHFWVEVRVCEACNTPFELHPHYQLAYSRKQKKQWVFCKSCHEVQELPINDLRFICHCNGENRTDIHDGTVRKGIVTCPNCGHSHKLARGKDQGPPMWYLFAQEYLIPEVSRPLRLFKKANDFDRKLFQEAGEELKHLTLQKGTIAPTRPIPSEGRQDQRPLIHGIHTYAELFNDRQLFHLTLLGHHIKSIEDNRVKRLLVMAFSEHLAANCMYTGYAFGYRRTSPLFSFHGYRHIIRPVELNPWLSGIGRGTFPNALRKIEKAIFYAGSARDNARSGGNFTSKPTERTIATNPKLVLDGESSAAIKTQSSIDISNLPNQSIDLILTDPPYFDNVSYSELSDFYLAWQQQLINLEHPYCDSSISAPINDNLAVTDHSVEAHKRYLDELTTIFQECWRVLKDYGLFVFTYHHKSDNAWLLLGKALAVSGLVCIKVLPMRGEGQGGLHTKDGSIKWDAVIICRKGAVVTADEEVELFVTNEEIETAKLEVQQYVHLFQKNEDIGFHLPDQLNFFRSLLATRASANINPKKAIPLSTALSLSIRSSNEKG